MAGFEQVGVITQRVLVEVSEPGLRGDSWLEERFWTFMQRTEDQWKDTAPQMQIGPYRVDAAVICGTHTVVIELDGRRWHLDKDADRRRDLFLLKHVDAVIRIPFAAMWWNPDATFLTLSRWYPRFKWTTPMSDDGLRHWSSYAACIEIPERTEGVDATTEITIRRRTDY